MQPYHVPGTLRAEEEGLPQKGTLSGAFLCFSLVFLEMPLSLGARFQVSEQFFLSRKTVPFLRGEPTKGGSPRTGSTGKKREKWRNEITTERGWDLGIMLCSSRSGP